MSVWRRIKHEGQNLYALGVHADGTLHNPNGYPEPIVRTAVAGAEHRRKQRRSAAARKAAETRQRRRERLVYQVADRIIAGHVYGPSHNCTICRKPVSDPDSIERGIGSDCWQGVLAAIERRHAQDGAP